MSGAAKKATVEAAKRDAKIAAQAAQLLFALSETGDGLFALRAMLEEMNYHDGTFAEAAVDIAMIMLSVGPSSIPLDWAGAGATRKQVST